MKISRRESIQAYQGLLALERGNDKKTYDFDWSTWDKIFQIMTCLQPVVESYNKIRKQKFLNASGGKNTIDDVDEALKFQKVEDDILSEKISVKMPKVLLKEDDLRLKDNKIPPSVRVQIAPFVVNSATIEMDGDEDNFDQ